MTTHNDPGPADDGTSCESCPELVQVRLADGSTWCLDCHCSALRLGYDTDRGKVIRGRGLKAADLADAAREALAERRAA